MDKVNQAWAIVGAVKSPHEAREAVKKLSAMDIDKYLYMKLIQAANEQYKRFIGR